MTSSAPRIFPSPVFVFDSIPQAVTCQPLAFSWFYDGPTAGFAFVVTNVGVPQDAPAPPLTSSSVSTSSTRGSFTGTDGKARRAIPTGAANPLSNVTLRVVLNVDPFLDAYTWPVVDVPQGWYQVNATTAVQSYTSAPRLFFVHTGSDTSCLAAVTGSPTPNPTTTPASTSSASTTPTSSPVLLPVGGASKVNSGAIAGATVGGVFLLAAILATWFCLQRKGKKSGALSSRSRKWNGLSSVDSRVLNGSGNQKNFSTYRHQSRSESLGTIPIGASEEAVGMEKSSIYGKYSENDGRLNGPGVVLAAMPVLHHQGQLQQHSPRSKANSRAYSVSSSNEFLPNEGVTPGRRPSVPDSVIGRQSIDSSNTYPPTSPVSPHAARNGPSNQFMAANMGRSQSSSPSITQPSSSSSPTQSTSSHAFPPHQNYQYQRPAPSPSPQFPTNPATPTSDAATKKANRNSLGGKKRKPVPAYDPSQEDVASLPVPRVAATPSPAPSFTSPHTPTSGGHYATRSQMGMDSSQHDLVHKSSFGPGGVEGKPLHYLIPDMPMQPKE
ncbi:hypothetical protein CPB84DRAFT_1744904 [Gymnopilus junonius]|uniref:Uncharacterized protein n=1 Tax=Gymnopilus junonius TaxID=109634 RepID=A0A9P5NWC4_GYMJU|nr:hypothetical protein CPB84DRAFT_1744904 [Gymnopilus junonius]